MLHSFEFQGAISGSWTSLSRLLYSTSQATRREDNAQKPACSLYLQGDESLEEARMSSPGEGEKIKTKPLCFPVLGRLLDTQTLKLHWMLNTPA